MDAVGALAHGALQQGRRQLTVRAQMIVVLPVQMMRQRLTQKRGAYILHRRTLRLQEAGQRRQRLAV